MAGVAEDLAKEAMRLAAHKLPIDVKFITRRDQEAAEATAGATAPAVSSVAVTIKSAKAVKAAPVLDAAPEAHIAPEASAPVAEATNATDIAPNAPEGDSNG
jgi:hypothetical protein